MSVAAPFDEAVDEFLRLHNRVLLLARRADGSPTGWPMTGIYADGILQFSTYRKSAKVRMIAADPRVCCLVTAREGLGERRVLEYVGTAAVDTEVREMPSRAQAPGATAAPTAIGTVPEEIGQRAQDRLASGKRCLIRVAPLRVGFLA